MCRKSHEDKDFMANFHITVCVQVKTHTNNIHIHTHHSHANTRTQQEKKKCYNQHNHTEMSRDFISSERRLEEQKTHFHRLNMISIYIECFTEATPKLWLMGES